MKDGTIRNLAVKSGFGTGGWLAHSLLIVGGGLRVVTSTYIGGYWAGKKLMVALLCVGSNQVQCPHVAIDAYKIDTHCFWVRSGDFVMDKFDGKAAFYRRVSCRDCAIKLGVIW